MPRLFHPSGLDVARLSDAEVVLGGENSYNWMAHRITLVRGVALSREPHCVLIAAHELGHSRQPRWLHLLRFLPSVRWYQEAKAWEFAIQWYADQQTWEQESRKPCNHKWVKQNSVDRCHLCGITLVRS